MGTLDRTHRHSMRGSVLVRGNGRRSGRGGAAPLTEPCQAKGGRWSAHLHSLAARGGLIKEQGPPVWGSLHRSLVARGDWPVLLSLLCWVIGWQWCDPSSGPGLAMSVKESEAHFCDCHGPFCLFVCFFNNFGNVY